MARQTEQGESQKKGGIAAKLDGAGLSFSSFVVLWFTIVLLVVGIN